jgi:hypothetical protein
MLVGRHPPWCTPVRLHAGTATWTSCPRPSPPRPWRLTSPARCVTTHTVCDHCLQALSSRHWTCTRVCRFTPALLRCLSSCCHSLQPSSPSLGRAALSTPIGPKDLASGLAGMMCPLCRRRGDKCRVFESRVSGKLMCETCMWDLEFVETSPDPSVAASMNRDGGGVVAGDGGGSAAPAGVRSAGVEPSASRATASSREPVLPPPKTYDGPLQCPRCKKTGASLRT